ncbi:MAG: penicillin-binding protein activator LpoB [Candidatus Omnitrophota bacterium]
MKRISVVSVAVLMLALAGCSTQVVRKDVGEFTDLSGRWNDSDARLVAEEMVRECVDGQWVSRFNKEKGRDPVVIVGTVVNRSHEHINADVFIQDLEMALVNAGKVRFVASKTERGEVREERLDQQQNAAVPTRAQMISETGADFMLQGSINSVKDEVKGQYAIMFQSNLELVDLTTNEKVWIGQKKIKKLVKRSQYSL